MSERTLLVVGEGDVASVAERSLSDRYAVQTATTRREIGEGDDVDLVLLTPSVETAGDERELGRRCDCPVVAICEREAEFDVDHCLCDTVSGEAIRSFVDETMASLELGDRADTCYEIAERMAELRARHSADELSTDPEFRELRTRLSDEHTRFADRLQHVPAEKAFPATLDDDADETVDETA